MNLTHLQTFYHVARLSGISAAADYLQVSKGLVSRHLQSLEAELNTSLLHRTTRRIGLTEAGQALYYKAQQITDLAQDAQTELRDITQESSGLLRFTAPIELGRLICRDILPGFVQQFPDILFQLDFDHHLKDITGGEFDLALRASASLPDDVIAKSLGKIRNRLVASPALLAKTGEITRAEELAQQPCILTSYGKRRGRWYLIANGDEQIVELKAAFSVNTYAGGLELALLGLGVASLPLYQVQPYLARGELVSVLPDYSLPTHDISLIYAKQRVIPAKIKQLRQAVLDWSDENKRYFIV